MSIKNTQSQELKEYEELKEIFHKKFYCFSSNLTSKPIAYKNVIKHYSTNKEDFLVPVSEYNV